MQSKILINNCKCGWNFMSLSKYETKCPQCRDIIHSCICCGAEIDGQINKRYCEKCVKINKKVYNKYRMQKIRMTMKDKFEYDKICDYDCANCKFSDCILPIDREDLIDDLTGNLFEVIK